MHKTKFTIYHLLLHITFQKNGILQFKIKPSSYPRKYYFPALPPFLQFKTGKYKKPTKTSMDLQLLYLRASLNVKVWDSWAEPNFYLPTSEHIFSWQKHLNSIHLLFPYNLWTFSNTGCRVRYQWLLKNKA